MSATLGHGNRSPDSKSFEGVAIEIRGHAGLAKKGPLPQLCAL
jgi:hypothetical protein